MADTQRLGRCSRKGVQVQVLSPAHGGSAMEISVGDFGRMIFEQTVGDKYTDPPEHWKSIMAEAEPLVRKLLALNDKMTVDGKPGGYQIHGYVEKGKKKKVRSEFERIRMAQEHALKVKGSNLKIGDRIWLLPRFSDHEMYVGQDDPVPVTDIGRTGTIYVEMRGCNYEYPATVNPNDDVLKAPKDWDEKEAEYTSKKFWLARADKFGF